MGYVDGYRLFGKKPANGQVYDLGIVQIDRAALEDEVLRHEALASLSRFAASSCFTDNERPRDLLFVLGHTCDIESGEVTYFEAPTSVNNPDEAVRLPKVPAPTQEIVGLFLADIVQLVA